MQGRFAFVCALALLVVPAPAAAQVELPGTFIEYLGIGSPGHMINASNRSMRWRATAAGAVTCDTYTPGVPYHAWTIQLTGSGGTVMATNGTTGGGPMSEVPAMAGPTATGREVTWSGRYVSGTNALTVALRYTFPMDAHHVQVEATVTNSGTTALTDVYFRMAGDPDQASACPGGTGPTTTDDIVRQPPAMPEALGYAQVLVPIPAVLVLGAHDTRARVHFYTGCCETGTMPSADYAAPRDPGGIDEDAAHGIIFREPSLAIGASTTFELFYVWGSTVAEATTRFDEVSFPTAPCVGLMEGAACTTSSGSMGLCRTGRCCTGCWNGTRCLAGTAAATCGDRGAMCTSCVDGDLCTTDVCSATGTCSNPDAPMGTACDDGLFCTRTDTCNATGTCGGAGARCDDAEECTTDSCNEATDMCTNAPRPDLTACMAGGRAGMCRTARCCTGCYDGALCQVGTGAGACGLGGGMCARCIDGDACTSDVCAAGACSNPDAPIGTSCSDGMFCTTTDTCDGSGSCVGGGAPRCNDMASCTADSCDEDMDRCVFTPVAGCTIGGVCVGMGTVNPTYPCQVCDPTRDMFDWSFLDEGSMCGPSSCAGGRLTERQCDAAGICQTVRSTCPSGACADTMSCEMPCMAGSCPAGMRCDLTTMMCVMLGDPGDTCMDDADCASGFCVDGTCCTEACDGTCERCDGAGGTCDPIAAGVDPDDECADGACDGTGACEGGADAGPTDAGRDAGGDGGGTDSGGGADGGRTDAGPGPGGDGGCGCTAPGHGHSSLLFMLVVIGWLLVRRRRL